MFTKQKPHELEPPNLTQEIKGRTASHHAVAESCMAMASVIESENPLLLTPETVQLIQEAFEPEEVAREVEHLLSSAGARAVMKTDLAEVARRLGPPGAIDRAADLIASMLRQ